MADFTPTIKVENIQPGMVLNFTDMVAESAGQTILNLTEGEVISVEAPDGLGDYFGIWVSPEDASRPEIYLHAYPWQSFEIVG